jgi:uncharacterized protein YegJ (DUF2314 family)
MQRHRIAAVLALLAVAACTRSITEWEKDYEATRMQSEALAMRQATERAQATLSDFLVKAKQPPAGTKLYGLKIAVQEGRDTEYFWVREFSWSNGTFMGRIDDEPRIVKSVKPGQIHKFSRSDIVDWTYTDENSARTFGNFTACALSGNKPSTGADGSQRRDGLDCS